MSWIVAYWPVWLESADVWRIIFLGVLLICLRYLRRLLTMGQQDRIAREIQLSQINRKATDLTRQAQEIADQVKARNNIAAELVREQLVQIDDKMDANTEMTKKAAEASAEAAHVANDVNAKIAATNEHLSKVVDSLTPSATTKETTTKK